MKHSPISRFAALTTMLLLGSSCLITINPGSARAQPTCPTGILPAGCSWSPGMPITELISMGGDPLDCADPPPPGYPHNCCFQITYCLACCNGVAYGTLESFQPGNFLCDNVDPQAMYKYAVHYLRGQAANHCGVPPCGGTGLQVTISTPTCWTQANPTGHYTYPPCSVNCYCQTTCDVCMNLDGSLAYSNCNTVTIGVCTCTPLPDPGQPWLTGTCYALPCPF